MSIYLYVKNPQQSGDDTRRRRRKAGAIFMPGKKFLLKSALLITTAAVLCRAQEGPSGFIKFLAPQAHAPPDRIVSALARYADREGP